MTVQAVLCWSEYYNSKWQPIKTSDIDRPITLDQFDATGQNVFDRSGLRLIASENGAVLRLTIGGGHAKYLFGKRKITDPAFVLYNTHSLPVGQDELRSESKSETDLAIDQRPASVYMSTFSDIWTVTYTKKGLHHSLENGRLKRPVLVNAIGDRTIQARHDLRNPWLTPFFYEDSRHVFYVGTTQEPVTVSQWHAYGVGANSSTQKLDIPPIVFEETNVIPDILGPIVLDPHVRVVDAAQIQRFVSEDAYIKRGLGATGTVQFGDKQIGPAGGLTIDLQE